MNTNFYQLFFQRKDAKPAEVRRENYFRSRHLSAFSAPLRFVFGAWLLTMTAHAKLNVVATTPDLASIAREIGGDKIELTTLAKPTEDPHFVDARPSFIVKLNRADVLIEGGAELEIGWLPALLDQSRNEKLAAGAPGHVVCSAGVQLLEVPAWKRFGYQSTWYHVPM